MDERSTDLRDQLSIETPELVGIEFPLAGIGSRCIALMIDSTLQGFVLGVILVAVVVLITALPGIKSVQPASGLNDAAKWAIAIIIVVPFLLQWGYFALFEAFWNGQTPGKRVLNLRVIEQSGRPIALFGSMTRNLLRIIDMLPGFYLVGAVCIFITRRQQRLGDMVAGTLVVHSVPAQASIGAEGNRTFTASVFETLPQPAAVNGPDLPADAVARLAQGDLDLMESFLVRRLDLPLDVRTRLGDKLAHKMAEKTMLQIPAGTSNETFVEGLILGIRKLGRLHS